MLFIDPPFVEFILFILFAPFARFLLFLIFIFLSLRLFLFSLYYYILDLFFLFFFSLFWKLYLCTVTLKEYYDVSSSIKTIIQKLWQKKSDHKWISTRYHRLLNSLNSFRSFFHPFSLKKRERERNFLISYFPRSRRKSETLVVQENWKPIRPPVYWFCKSSRNSESSGGGRGRRLTLAKAINKNTGARAPNTFRFRPSVGRASGSHPFLPALEVINPTEPRLRVFNFRATFLFMCTTYRNRFCRLKLLKSVEINEKPRQIDRNKGTSDDTLALFPSFWGLAFSYRVSTSEKTTKVVSKRSERLLYRRNDRTFSNSRFYFKRGRWLKSKKFYTWNVS